jgi:hypothetical protein
MVNLIREAFIGPMVQQHFHTLEIRRFDGSQERSVALAKSQSQQEKRRETDLPIQFIQEKRVIGQEGVHEGRISADLSEHRVHIKKREDGSCGFVGSLLARKESRNLISLSNLMTRFE